MKKRTLKGLLAVMLVIVLMLSLVPLGAVTPAAVQDKATPIESETISEICSQKEVVNNAKPAPADGYIVKLLDESFADGLTCISADDGHIECLPFNTLYDKIKKLSIHNI